MSFRNKKHNAAEWMLCRVDCFWISDIYRPPWIAGVSAGSIGAGLRRGSNGSLDGGGVGFDFAVAGSSGCC